MATLREVVAVLDGLYDPAWADDWDAVGTIVGDPDAEITSILFAVDPVAEVVAEAIEIGAQLIVTHHPLYLKGTTTVAASTPKGRVVHELIANGIALHNCHTNADCAPLGVSESMALALSLTDLRPLEVDVASAVDKWVVFVPNDYADQVSAAMHAVGAGQMGAYDQAQFRTLGKGSFRPLSGAMPAIGSVGEVEWVDETRIELVADPKLRDAVLAAMLDAHPYEEVAYDLWQLAAKPSDRGTGRIGRLARPMTLAEFGEQVKASLPQHEGATRIAGDLDRVVETVALCGGSGDFLLPTATAAGADVYVTSDLRHHVVSEHLQVTGSCSVIDVPHWAAEWTWLPVAAAAVGAALGDTVKTRVSTIVTDPWTRTLATGGTREG